MAETDDPFSSLQLSSASEPSDSESNKRASKLRQTETAFQAQKAQYYASFVPVGVTAVVSKQDVASKGEALALKAQAEEKYYMRDYPTAMGLAQRVLLYAKQPTEGEGLHVNEKKELEGLVQACERRRVGMKTV